MRLFCRHLLVAAALSLSLHARADFYLVAQAVNPQRALTQKEAVDLFMGRNRAFSNGDIARVFDMPRDHPQRAPFYQALTGMGPAQVNSYWARLMFSGQTMPPQVVVDEAAMIDIVKRNPGGLGWLSKEPNDKGLRILLVIKEST